MNGTTPYQINTPTGPAPQSPDAAITRAMRTLECAVERIGQSSAALAARLQPVMTGPTPRACGANPVSPLPATPLSDAISNQSSKLDDSLDVLNDILSRLGLE